MPQGASVHMCVGDLQTGSHTAPHGLSWEIREPEGRDSPQSTHSSQNSRNVNLALGPLSLWE